MQQFCQMKHSDYTKKLQYVYIPIRSRLVEKVTWKQVTNSQCIKAYGFYLIIASEAVQRETTYI